jgi:hypothetical protein
MPDLDRAIRDELEAWAKTTSTASPSPDTEWAAVRRDVVGVPRPCRYPNGLP